MKKLLTWLLAIAICITGIPVYAFAADTGGGSALKRGVQYMMPVKRLDRYGDVISWARSDPDYPNDNKGRYNVSSDALVSMNEDGTYNVTLEYANYASLDTIQFFKQDAFSGEVDIHDLTPGTVGIKDRFILDYKAGLEESEEEMDFTDQLKGLLDAGQNDKIMQDVSVEERQDGTARLTLNLQSLDQPVYFVAIETPYFDAAPGSGYPDNTTEEGRKTILEKLEHGCIKKGAFSLRPLQAKIVPALSEYHTENTLRFVREAVWTQRYDQDFEKGMQAEQLLDPNVGITQNEDGSITASFTVRGDANIAEIREAEGTVPVDEEDIYSFVSGHTNRLSEKYGGKNPFFTYSDNLLNDNTFSVRFASAQDAAFGKIIRMIVPDEEQQQMYDFVLGLGVQDSHRRFSSGGMSFEIERDRLDPDTVFSVKRVTGGEKYDSIQKLLYGYSAKNIVYSTSLKAGEQNQSLKRTIEVALDIPEGFRADRLILYMLESDTLQGDMIPRVRYTKVENGKFIFETKDLNRIYILSETAEAVDLSQMNLSDGIYQADMAFWNAAEENEISMSNAALVPKKTRITVKGGKYFLSMHLRPIRVLTEYGHVKNLYYEGKNPDNPDEITEATYLGYDTTEDGTSVYNTDYHAKKYGFYYPSVFSFEIPKRAIKRNDLRIHFYVPVMAELSGRSPDEVKDPIAEDETRDVRVKFYNLKAAEGETEQSYETSWLLKRVEDADHLLKESENNRLMYEDQEANAAFRAQAEETRAAYGASVLQNDGDAIKEAADQMDAATEEFLHASLNAQIARARALNQENYQEEGFRKMTEMLEEAVAVYNRKDASAEEAHTALLKLYTSITSLRRVDETDKAQLEEALRQAKEEAAKTDLYTPSSIHALQDLIEAAERVFENPDSEQSEIDAQKENLDAGISGLVAKADKSQLQKQYDEANQIFTEGNEGGVYHQAVWDAFSEAVAQAKAMLENEDAQAGEVESARVRLVNAQTQLNAAVDRGALSALIDDAKKTELTGIEENSRQMLQAAIASAEETEAAEASTQSEIDKQYMLLYKAMHALLADEEEGTIHDGTYRLFGRLWQAGKDVPENWKNGDAQGASLGDPALDHNIDVEIKDGKPTLTIQFLKRKLRMFNRDYEGYLKSLGYFPAYQGKSFPQGRQPVMAEILAYWEDENGKRISDEYGTDYPRYLKMAMDLTVDQIQEPYLWVKVNVPVMDAITPGSGTQPAKLVLDWAGMEQLSGVNSDKDTLKEQVSRAKQLQKGDASDRMFAALTAAVAQGEYTIRNINADQASVNAVSEMLQAAIDAMSKDNTPADKSELKKAIAQAEEILNDTAAPYTEASLDVLRLAYEEAKKTDAAERVSMQAVNAAVMQINHALEALQETSDKKELGRAIREAEEREKMADSYTAAALTALKQIRERAQAVYGNSNASKEETNASVAALDYLLKHMRQVEAKDTDKEALGEILNIAYSMYGRAGLYTEASVAALKQAIEEAQAAYDNKEGIQEEMLRQKMSALTHAVLAAEMRPETVFSGGDGSQATPPSDGRKTDVQNLSDGVYMLEGRMLKVDKSTPSMADGAIHHKIKLTVKDGNGFVTMHFRGLEVGGQLGYLGKLNYYLTGYGTDEYGAPTGALGDVTVDTVQQYQDGTIVSDVYGSNYPAQVTFPLIPEAKNNGFVPLRVTVPLMEALNAGNHPVYLFLDWNTIQRTTEDDAGFTSVNENDKAKAKSASLSGQTGAPASSLPKLFSGSKSIRPAKGAALPKLRKGSAGGIQAPSLKPIGSVLKNGSHQEAALPKQTAPTLLKTKAAKDKTVSAGTVKGKADTTKKNAGKESSGSASGKAPVQAAAAIAVSFLAAVAGALYKLRSRKLFF